MKSTLRLLFASTALLGMMTAALPVRADLLVDRGLPTANLNNAAGADRANVSWAFTEYTSPDYWVVGDTFANTSSQNWAISTIRLWTVGETDTAVLRAELMARPSASCQAQGSYRPPPTRMEARTKAAPAPP